MADTIVVLDNLLCFLIAKYGKTASQQLKQVIIDFYQFEDIYAAKKHLLEAVDSWKSDIRLPHIPTRRDGEQRSAKSLDDIFTVITLLDENLKLKDLPKFVSESPDCMPSVRLCDGDLFTLTVAFDKLRDRLTNAEVMLAAILKVTDTSRDLLIALRDQCATLQRRTQPASSEQLAFPALGDVTGQSVGSSVYAAAAVTSGIPKTSLGSSADQLSQDQLPPSSDWASLVSTPVIHSNRFDILASTDEEQSDGGRFVEQRAARLKRRREQSSLQKRQQQREIDDNQRQRAGVRRSRAPLMVGKLVSAGASVAAAKQLFKKAVFCVDNVGKSNNAEDIRAFVSSMAVNVISCFEVKPRRRRDDGEGEIKDRKAFRLCIRADDQDRLLDDKRWPNSIAISEWYFKPPPTVDDKRRRICENVSAATGGVHTASINPAVDMDHGNDDDQTIPLDSTMTNEHTTDGAV